ncbi:hypothetical protein [Mogibacterium sp.]|uniref:hypothetical protein n=1 Tax=Mogibacterium sp. TaxID=2049035 RepID=UPI00257FB137|nr:hypothetical protein [Mogibacterium sp.]MBN2936252.1 hypothetical protein [Mogibacterium sp.]
MNGLYALTIILVVYAIGDFIATKSKAIISMLFVASILFAIGFWNGLPATIFQDSTLQLFASVTVGLMLVHMGTTIKLKELVAEWKTVVLVLCSTIGICLGVYFIGQLIIERYEALIAAPIVGGGVVAFLVMSEALQKAGANVVLFGSMVLILQGVIGFPIASILCKKEALRLRGMIRNGQLIADAVEGATGETKKSRLKFIPDVPEKYRGANFMLAKLAVVACLAQYLANLTGNKVNMLVICLLLGVLFHEFGFLEEGAMEKANGFTFVIGAVLTNVFANLANTTPGQLVSMIKPMIIIFVIGLASCALISIIIGKIFGESWYMSFALGVTALFGFPGTYIVPSEVAKAVGETEEEQHIILQHIMPRMLIAGMVSVSIVSVLFAGVMVNWI